MIAGFRNAQHTTHFVLRQNLRFGHLNRPLMNFSAVLSIFSSRGRSYRKGIDKDLFDLSGIAVVGELLCISLSGFVARPLQGQSLPVRDVSIGSVVIEKAVRWDEGIAA